MKDLSSAEFLGQLTATAETISRYLEQILSDPENGSDTHVPVRLVDAMRHGVLNGGKRLRPFLVLESARLFDVERDAVMSVAAALECIHCYSLIHDDLPSMDDDELRRGKPTVHIAFDEATAILAGDALLTLAFDLVARFAMLGSSEKLALVRALSNAAGLHGMVGGQMLDLQHEHQSADADMVTQIHAMKTGALIRFACEAGAISGNAVEKEYDAIVRYGEILGVTFQLADDLLDVTASSADLGKTAGKDVQAGKKTHIALYGEAWARDRLKKLVADADEALQLFGQKADVLRAAARFAAYRDY